jgi:hypothetical protein
MNDPNEAIVLVHRFEESGTCAFCQKEDKEGVVCSFQEGKFEGFLCRNDFWKFLRFNSPAAPRREEKATPLFDNGR